MHSLLIQGFWARGKAISLDISNTGQDAMQETEKWAELAALASAADSAHFSISCRASCPVTLYSIG